MKITIKNITLITIGLVVGRASKNINHYQTHYEEDGIEKIESWIQVDLFNKCYCFSNKIHEI